VEGKYLAQIPADGSFAGTTFAEKMEPPEKIQYQGLILLSLGHLVIDLTVAAMPVILPFIKEALNLSYAMAGTIIMVFSLTSSVIQPAFGYLTDRKSLIWFVPLGCLVATSGLSLLGWAQSYGQILYLMVFSGIGVAIYHPEGWRIANFFAGRQKATGMSIFGVGGNLGIALGPLLVLYFVKILGLKGAAVFFVPGALMAGIFLFTRFWRVRLPREAKKEISLDSAPTWRSAVYPMSLLVAMVMLRSWSHIGLMTFIPFYYINVLQGDPMRAGHLLFAFLIAGTVGTFVGGPLADRLGYKKILLFSLGGGGLLLILFLLSSGVWAYIWFILAGLIIIFSFPISMVMGQHFLPRNVGMASGLILGLSLGMGGVGAAVLGLFADHFGVPLTLWVIALIPLGAFLLAIFIPYPGPQGD
jgi:FSR family fosmidomycin resistance protein-like MFS transporter